MAMTTAATTTREEGSFGGGRVLETRAYNLKLPAILKGGLFSLVRCMSFPWMLWD